MRQELDGAEVLAISVAAVVVVLAAVGGAMTARARKTPPPASNLPSLAIPFASDQLDFDGELDEASWRASARSGSFKARNGKEATPYSDARFDWTSSSLRVGLYAADQDIVSADAFHVEIDSGGTKRALDVNAKCAVNGLDGVRVACDSDGTVDVPGDMDEEWVVEMEIPLAAIGLAASPGARTTITIRRCDADTKHRAQRPEACGVFGPVELVLHR